MSRNLYTELDRMVKKAFSERLTASNDSPTIAPGGPIYESIEDYKVKTGRRFRQTKQDKEAGLSREESFAKMYGTEPTNQDSGND
jgi:hypothetical protein